MPSYWDRFAELYASLGEARFWLKHRLRMIEGLSGRVLDACCGGGQLVLELLRREVDAYGIDLSPKMCQQARIKLTEAGYDPHRITSANVMRLPFAAGQFDTVVATGSLGLLGQQEQKTAIRELTRVTRHEIRLLESFEKRKGLYLGRVLALMFDGMRPIPQEVFRTSGLDCTEEWDIFGGAFSYVHCLRGNEL